jgi:prephenate dehydrogenase
VKIYVAAVEALRKTEDRMKLSLPPKLMEKLVHKLPPTFHKKAGRWVIDTGSLLSRTIEGSQLQ